MMPFKQDIMNNLGNNKTKNKQFKVMSQFLKVVHIIPIIHVYKKVKRNKMMISVIVKSS